MPERKLKIIDRTTVWQGRWQAIEVLTVSTGLSDYQIAVMRGSDGAVIVAINDNDEVAIVEVYRVALDDFLFELPAGKIAPGEVPLEAARRELAEETGIVASSWQSLGSAFGSQGASDWKCHYFLAQNLSYREQCLQADESHRLLWVPASELWTKVENGWIRDNFSITGIAKALFALGKNC